MGVDLYKDVVLQLVGNLYGRRPAGSNYRKEFEEVVTQKLATKGYQFKRGKRDPNSIHMLKDWSHDPTPCR